VFRRHVVVYNSYNSTEVKLKHCSIRDTPMIHNTMPSRS